jgi:hypothetical protein
MASDNAQKNITFLALSSVKLSRLCPTIKGSKSLETLFKSVSTMNNVDAALIEFEL